MAIRGYFEPVRFPLTAVTLRNGLAGSGISVEGPVLEGRRSVDEALVLSWIRGRGVGAGGAVAERAGVQEVRREFRWPDRLGT